MKDRGLVSVSVAVGVVVLALSGSMVRAQTVQGVVFEDLNGNAQRDAGEPGLPGVVVSNQEQVVVSDAEGRYTLPVSDDTIIFVSKPPGYMVPLNRYRLPRFFYIHKPAGSPKLHYAGVAPTGPLPESVDFPLRSTPEPDRFSIIALGDPQPETMQEVQYIRDDVLTELVGTEAAFGVTLGDIMGNMLNLYNGYNDAVSQVGIPFYNIIGNHDLNFDAPDDRMSDETFHLHFGPNYYSWNYGQVHFVALDDVEWMGAGRGGGNYRGAFGERQLRWLAGDLAQVPADRLVALMMHIPISTQHRSGCIDRDKLFEVLEGRSRVLVLSGHTHLQEHKFYDAEDGWTAAGSLHELNCATVCGSWWSGPKDIRGIPVADNCDGVPNGYTIITFEGNEYVTEYRAAGYDRDYRMRIYPPGSTGFDEAAKRRLVVNVFDGSDRCKVEYSLDRQPFLPMQRTPQRDPVAIAYLSGVLDSGKPWARPFVSQHIWSVELPEPLSRATHVVTIRVTDHFDRVYEQSKIFVP